MVVFTCREHGRPAFHGYVDDRHSLSYTAFVKNGGARFRRDYTRLRVENLHSLIAGLLSSTPTAAGAWKLTEFVMIDGAARNLGLSLFGEVMELDNLTLVEIPKLRLTDHGLVGCPSGIDQ